MKTMILNLLEGIEEAVAAVSAVEIDRRLSLKPFIAYLEDKAKNNQHIKSAFIRFVLDQFAKYPELETNPRLDSLMSNQKLLDLIYATLSVSIDDESNKLWGLSAPMTPLIFYGTDDLYELLLDSTGKHVKYGVLESQIEIMRDKRPELIYTLILDKVFGFENAFKKEMIRTLVDDNTGLIKYYRLNFDMRFLNVYAKEELPQLTHEKIQAILHEQKPLVTLFNLLPLKAFQFEGLSVITLTDVTDHYSIENIKSLIFNKSLYPADKYYSGIIESLKSLIEKKDVEFGLLPLLMVNNKLVFNESTCLRSKLIGSAKEHGIAEAAYLGIAENYFRNPRLLFYKTITPEDEARQIYLKLLKQDGICSYALMPIFYKNQLAGVLEVYSRINSALDETLLSKLDPAIPLIAQVLQGSIDDFNQQIEGIVKEKFTSLQPSVQWKFNEAAWLYMKKSFILKKNPKMETIFFRDLYPLYGAVDIRNSTIERNYALKKDLQAQFDVLQNSLEAIMDKTNLPIIGELIYKCRKKFGFVLDTEAGNEEINIHDFLAEEVDPVMAYFRRTNSATIPVIENYYKAVDEKFGVVWENRRQLEQSMETITNSINNYLDLFLSEQKEPYPCYFEKFRTDGIEYDIYIGQSIAPQVPFDVLYVKNLRLWQVASMAAIAKLTHMLKPQLPKQLETTQLIFTNSHTIDICFRNDERRFDVEGAYNIRYQIIKKRIDKVHIKGTRERLTQTGKIAIIYYNNRDAEEYIKYIQYLQEQGTLLNDLEEIDLEELQGVRGLKALRVGVMLDDVKDDGERKEKERFETVGSSE